LRMNIEGITLEISAVVRSSDANIGMGVSFQKSTADNQARLALALRHLQSRAVEMPEPGNALAKGMTRSMAI
jgi:hypothetical protein